MSRDRQQRRRGWHGGGSVVMTPAPTASTGMTRPCVLIHHAHHQRAGHRSFPTPGAWNMVRRLLHKSSGAWHDGPSSIEYLLKTAKKLLTDSAKRRNCGGSSYQRAVESAHPIKKMGPIQGIFSTPRRSILRLWLCQKPHQLGDGFCNWNVPNRVLSMPMVARPPSRLRGDWRCPPRHQRQGPISDRLEDIEQAHNRSHPYQLSRTDRRLCSWHPGDDPL